MRYHEGFLGPIGSQTQIQGQPMANGDFWGDSDLPQVNPDDGLRL